MTLVVQFAMSIKGHLWMRGASQSGILKAGVVVRGWVSLSLVHHSSFVRSLTPTIGAEPYRTGPVPASADHPRSILDRMSDIGPAQRHVLDEAHRVNEERMAAIEQLAKSVARRVELEQELGEAKREEKRLMAAAEKQGWTRAQVNKFAKPPKNTSRKPAENVDNQSNPAPPQQGSLMTAEPEQ